VSYAAGRTFDQNLQLRKGLIRKSALAQKSKARNPRIETTQWILKSVALFLAIEKILIRNPKSKI
jgi:hypothetical protein